MPKFEFETNLTDPFISAYVTALFWTNEIDAVVDEIRQELNGFALLKTEFTINDLAPTTWAAIIMDCADFQRLAGDLGASDPSGAGHDFWLTRAGTGAGFWDGDWTYPEGIGDVLTELSRQFGEAEMYAGDDGLIYQSGRETWSQIIAEANRRRDWLPVELPTPIPGEGQKLYVLCAYGSTTVSMTGEVALTDEEFADLDGPSDVQDLLYEKGFSYDGGENIPDLDGAWIQDDEGNELKDWQ